MAQKKNRYMLEFMSIVFAVTLALVLDEWRQSVKDDKLRDRVLNSIKAEVLANMEIVEQAIPYRQSLIQELREGRHEIVTLPLSDIPVDINNDRRLSSYLEEALLAGQRLAYDRVEVRRANEECFLILNDNVWRLVVSSDSLKIYGSSNIQLRGGQLANNAWQLSQATQVMMKLPFKLIELLAQLNSRQATYTGVATQAIEKIYSGDSKVMGVLQDMLWIERQLKKDYEEILTILDEEL